MYEEAAVNVWRSSWCMDRCLNSWTWTGIAIYCQVQALISYPRCHLHLNSTRLGCVYSRLSSLDLRPWQVSGACRLSLSQAQYGVTEMHLNKTSVLPGFSESNRSLSENFFPHSSHRFNSGTSRTIVDFGIGSCPVNLVIQLFLVAMSSFLPAFRTKFIYST